MISKSNFATMPPNARGYTAGRYGGREDQPHVRKGNPYPPGSDAARLFTEGYRDGQQARKECGE